MREQILTTLAILTLVLGWALPGHANVLELTSRPTTNDMVFWSQFGSTSGSLPATDNFTSTHGISGSVNLNNLSGFLGIQCCIIVNNNLVGNFSGGFKPGDFVLSTYLGPMTIKFDTPVRAVGAQILYGRSLSF